MQRLLDSLAVLRGKLMLFWWAIRASVE